MVNARADLSEPSSSPCLGFALRPFEFLILMFVLPHSFQLVLHSNPFLVRIVSGSCLLSCMFAWSVAFDLGYRTSRRCFSLCRVSFFFDSGLLPDWLCHVHLMKWSNSTLTAFCGKSTPCFGNCVSLCFCFPFPFSVARITRSSMNSELIFSTQLHNWTDQVFVACRILNLWSFV